MKVAMIGWEFPPFIAGGLGVHCLELTRGLSRCGIDIDFYMPRIETVNKATGVAEEHDHARIIEVDADPDVTPYPDASHNEQSPNRGYQAKFNEAVSLYNDRVTSAFESHDSDLLHCHDWVTVPAALTLRQRTGLPLLFTVHSTEIDRSGGLRPQGWIQDIERDGIHGADHIITVSNYTKNLIQESYDAPPTRVTPVYNGVNFDELHDAEERDYDQRRRTVLFLSRLVQQKGPMQFLEAARRVLKVNPQARFIIAGDGPLLQEMIAFTIDHDMASNVRFAGYVPEEDLAEVYRQSGIYVLPSVSEPFGISILEAMATGLPTIVSKTTGVGEALDHVLKADFWDVDEMADMMIRLLASPALREELGKNGGREVHRFTWEDCCQETEQIYHKLAHRSIPQEDTDG